MEIKAVVDRIENGYAVLRPEGYGMEICVPVDASDKKYSKGENITLMLKANDENNG